MATRITDACINCGRCVPVCPAHGITRGDEVFVIDSARCTECVGFHPEQQCARVCPAECCEPDPAHVESEATLFERARILFPKWRDHFVLSRRTSHFRADASLRARLRAAGRQLGAHLLGTRLDEE